MAPIVATGAARAQDLTPLTQAQADGLRRALGLTDPAVLAPEAGRVTIFGDGYVLRLPIDGGRPAALFWGADYALRARPLDAGRWHLDQLTLPALFRIGPDRASFDPVARLRTSGLTYAAAIDPAHATPDMSRLRFTALSVAVGGPSHDVQDLAITLESGAGKLDRDMGSLVDGRAVDHIHGELADARVTVPLRDPLHLLIGGLKVDLLFGGVDPGALRAFRAGEDALATAVKSPPLEPPPSTLPAAPPATPLAAPPSPTPPPVAEPSESDDPDAPPPAVRTALRQLIPLLRATFASSTLSAEATQLNVIGGSGPAVHVDRARVSLSGGAAAGKLDVALGLTVDGLSIPDAPEIDGLLPRHLAVTPHVGGVTIDDLAMIADRLIDNPSFGTDNLKDPVVTLLSHGPLRLSIDGLDVEVGPTRLHAAAAAEAASLHARDAAGTADVSATRLDALIDTLTRDRAPRDVVRGMIYLKSLGRAEGDRTTWHVEFDAGKLMVNDQDFRSIVPVEP